MEGATPAFDAVEVQTLAELLEGAERCVRIARARGHQGIWLRLGDLDQPSSFIARCDVLVSRLYRDIDIHFVEDVHDVMFRIADLNRPKLGGREVALHPIGTVHPMAYITQAASHLDPDADRWLRGPIRAGQAEAAAEYADLADLLREFACRVKRDVSEAPYRTASTEDDSFTSPSPPQVAEDQAALNEFVPRGDRWYVCFHGNCGSIRDSIGMKYIAYLLARRDEPVAATSLRALTGRAPQWLRVESAEVALESGLEVTGPSEDPVIDEVTQRRLEAHLDELRGELGECSDPVERTSIGERIAMIEDYRRGATYRGRPRELDKEKQRARRAVGQAIQRAIDNMADLPELQAHFQSAIHTGAQCSYRPVPPEDWITT